MDSLVSIIIPVYNVEKYLEKCINSILAQTYTRLEIILVDDGSTDQSGKLCDLYKEKDERVSVIHKKNGGLSEARNYGIDAACGDYIAFVDSDDYVSNVFIETLLSPLESNNNCDMTVLAKAKSFYDGDTISLANNKNECLVEYKSSKDVLAMMFYQKVATGAPFKMCKREVFHEIKFPIGYYYEDMLTTYKELLRANNVAIVFGDLYAYRERHNSITHQPFSNRKMVVTEIRDMLLTDKDINRLGLVDAAIVRCFAVIFNVFLQMPPHEKKNMKKIWHLICKDRKIILKDKSGMMPKKNKYAALLSFSGMKMTHFLGNIIPH